MVYNIMIRLKQWLFKVFGKQCLPTALDPMGISAKPSEPEFITVNEYTYKTELQIVMRDGQVLCSDYTETTEYNYHDDSQCLVEYFLAQSYKKGHVNTFDKSNKYHTAVPIGEIKKILYKKPIVNIQSKEIRNWKYNA